MLTRAQRALQAETGAVSPERLRALRFALLARRDDARSAAKEPGLDERFAASLRGKAKGYQEAADLAQQLLYGAPMHLPRWSTARKKARAYQERRRARIAARSGLTGASEAAELADQGGAEPGQRSIVDVLAQGEA